MSLLRSLGAVATASGESAIDWSAVEAAATASTPPGSIDVGSGRRAAIAADVDSATERIEATAGLAIDGPDAVTVQSRHHWIEANVETLGAALGPLADRPSVLPGVARRANTATVAGALAALSRLVLGQYDPPLFRSGSPRLLLVLPNVERAATGLPVDPSRFRRWIVFHEVAHVAEFESAPWLADLLEDRVETAISAVAHGSIDREALADVDRAMTAVEGYAEFLMDRAYDGPVAALRAALEDRRRAGGPLETLLRRLLGLGAKRRQYERGRAFFESVASARGVEATGTVWDAPSALPTRDELAAPSRWIDRVDP